MLIDTDATVARRSHVKKLRYKTLLELVDKHGNFILKLYEYTSTCTNIMMNLCLRAFIGKSYIQGNTENTKDHIMNSSSRLVILED